MPNETSTAVATQQHAPLPVAFNARDEFELALRQAKVYAASTIVPEQYRDNLPNCLIALNMAKRIGSDPMQTMQSLYIVHGRPGWSAQFLIATFNQCGKFSALRYEMRGDDPSRKDYGVRAYATERATGEKIYGPWIDWKIVDAEGWAKKSGSKWQSIPGLMFQYRAAAWLIRTHAPELAMGLQTTEEIGDVIDVTPTAVQAPVSSVERLKEQVRTALHVDTKAPDVSEESVAADLRKATNTDALDAAATLIDAVEGDEPKQRLLAIYKERQAELQQ